MAAKLMPRNRAGMGLMERFRQETEDLFSRFFDDTFLTPVPTEGLVGTWKPMVDVSETDSELLVKVDLPGVEPKDVSITVKEGMLVIEGERKGESEEKGKEFHRVERFVGRFYRSMLLPPTADADKIRAESANGVIEVHVPKMPTAHPKKIAVAPAPKT